MTYLDETSSFPSIPRQWWGQRPILGATGYTFLYVCPICDRLCLRDPDQEDPRARVQRVASSEEQTMLATLRATRIALPRMRCRICSVALGAFASLEEHLDRSTAALVGIVGRHERLGGPSLVFALRRADYEGTPILAPLAHPDDVKRLLLWLADQPLPPAGRLEFEMQRACDPFEEALRLDLLPPQVPDACAAPDVANATCDGDPQRWSTGRIARYEARYQLEGHQVWGKPVHLVAAITAEYGSDLNVVSIYARVRETATLLLRRDFGGHSG